MSDLALDRIILDDCMNYMRSMPDKSVTMTLTDIPYNECNKPAQIRVIDKGEADTLDFDLKEFVAEVKRVTQESIYIFCGIQQISTLYTELHKDMAVRLCHWEKTNPSPMNGQFLWMSATENCLFAKFSGAQFNEHCKSNVWRFPSGTAKTHPTEKSLNLFCYLVNSSTKPNDIVFDPCIGSGTTAMACICTDRHFIGVEKNEKWFKKCNKRIKSEVDHDLFRDDFIT